MRQRTAFDLPERMCLNLNAIRLTCVRQGKKFKERVVNDKYFLKNNKNRVSTARLILEFQCMTAEIQKIYFSYLKREEYFKKSYFSPQVRREKLAIFWINRM